MKNIGPFKERKCGAIKEMAILFKDDVLSHVYDTFGWGFMSVPFMNIIFEVEKQSNLI